MQLHIQPYTIHKRFPLTISRGTSSQSTNLWVRLEQDGIEGWGEASPFSTGSQPQTTEVLQTALQQIVPTLAPYHPWEQQKITSVLAEQNLPSAAWAAIDVALHDWMGKAVGQPLWKLWGLDRDRISPISVTIGINSPEAAAARTQAWLNFIDVQVLKVKLGSPVGIAADQAMFRAVKSVAPDDAVFYVDANGGWNLSDALTMAEWLAAEGVQYLEQPLAPAEVKVMPQLYRRSPLPIFVDESCFTSSDIPKLAPWIHGINIKLMKSGGLAEAMRMVNIAQACDLQIMLGCYSNSALANTAAAHLSPLANYVDLDSHLNLLDDPFQGAEIQNGCLIPKAEPGLGVTRAMPHRLEKLRNG
ncbi:MAG: dipeptide epimerase [Microcoleaceae cyanobacterium]